MQRLACLRHARTGPAMDKHFATSVPIHLMFNFNRLKNNQNTIAAAATLVAERLLSQQHVRQEKNAAVKRPGSRPSGRKKPACHKGNAGWQMLAGPGADGRTDAQADGQLRPVRHRTGRRAAVSPRRAVPGHGNAGGKLTTWRPHGRRIGRLSDRCGGPCRCGKARSYRQRGWAGRLRPGGYRANKPAFWDWR